MLITSNDQIVYFNDNPNSPFNCRPIKISYQKETSELIQSEISYIQSEFSTSIETNLFGKNVKIEIEAFGTMLDGKAISAVEEISSAQVCNVCNMGPKNASKIHPKNV